MLTVWQVCICASEGHYFGVICVENEQIVLICKAG